MMFDVEMTQVDADSLRFLRTVWVGSYTDPFVAASNRAYRDFNRTLRFRGMANEKRTTLRDRATEVLRTEINRLQGGKIRSQDEFDAWHKTVCSQVREIYLMAGIGFTYGQAQKWLNMTLKNLYILGTCDFHEEFAYLHVPVDNYVCEAASHQLCVQAPSIAWSKWDDYDRLYMDYQRKLRKAIQGVPPLRWEFRAWVEENDNRWREMNDED